MKEIYLGLLIFLFSGCTLFKKSHSTNELSFEGTSIEQSGKTTNLVNPYTELSFSKTHFSLSFEILPYNFDNKALHMIQIAATSNKENLKYFKEGAVSNQNPFFSYTGTVIASYENKPYNSMYVVESGHHSIYYENETDKNADIIGKRKNGKIRLKWDIDHFTINKKKTEIESANFNELYVMIFIDHNLNKSIDKGEYNLVKINFK